MRMGTACVRFAALLVKGHVDSSSYVAWRTCPTDAETLLANVTPVSTASSCF
jgi:hypothetical protein